MALARGVRNNNPGDIRAVQGVTWRGQIGVDDKGFVIFDTLAHGFRALYIVLRTYRYKYGLKTIQDIVTRYAPSNENDTSAYIQAVSRMTNIPPDSVIQVEQYPALMVAIAKEETGTLYTVSDAAQGVALA